MLFCPITSHTSALESATSDQITVSPDRPKPTLSVSLAPNTELDITPSTKGTFASSSTKLSVATTNSGGYKVYIAAISKDQDVITDYTSAAIMTNLDPTVKGAIVSLSDEMQFLPKDFPMNSWGLALSEEPLDESSRYQGIKNQPDDNTSSLEPFLSVLEDDASHTYNLGLGAMMDASLPAGTYTADLLVSVVAEPAKLTGLLSIDYMQDMTPEICNATYLHETKQLVDIRDNKTYWVAKLKDGNCWMTQNLALDLDPSRPLTPETSDVITSWTPPTSTKEPRALWGDELEVDVNNIDSWTSGNYLLATPTKRKRCQAGEEDMVDDNSNLALCPEFQDVTNWNDTFVSQPGVWNNESLDYVSADQSSRTYDAHYLVGNYYTYVAATAGSGYGLVSPKESATDPSLLVDAPNSICPRGWRLPLGGSNNKKPYDRDDSYYRLLLAYGYPVWSDYLSKGNTPILDGINQNPFKGPMHFLAGGRVEIAYEVINNAGLIAKQLTATAGTNYTRAFLLYIDNDNINPAYVMFSDAYNVRCIAR